NGENTLFWEDIWLGEISLNHKYLRLFALEQSKNITVAEKLGHTSLSHSFRRLPRGGIEEEQQRDLLSFISGVILYNMSDRWLWSQNASGEFTVCSVRNLIDGFTLPSLESPTRWINLVPINLNVNAWRVRHDYLPTRLNLSIRGLDIPSILCPLCNTATESTSHIFFFCHLARQVMIKVCRWWDIDYSPLFSYEEWLSWLLNSRLSKLKKEILEGQNSIDIEAIKAEGEIDGQEHPSPQKSDNHTLNIGMSSDTGKTTWKMPLENAAVTMA
ncbi:RNA-directed DNA polymerase, eukaryota, reverse transcriptase zinc-binding domain protein, partial [Tanacetum coccineum]